MSEAPAMRSFRRSVAVPSIIGGLALGFFFHAGLAQTAPAPSSQPISAPVVMSADDLIKQLGNDNADDRDSAQKQLVDLGAVVVPALKKAAEENDDPEIRTRAAAALAQMKDLDENGASLITLHMKDAAPQEVLAAIGAQSHTTFSGVGTAAMPGAVSDITVDADRKPFWDVMTDVCTQLEVGPTMQPPGRNAIQLFPAARNWMALSPHQVVGPYWINVAGLYRARAVDLMGPPRVEDDFTIRLMVLPEPKLAVMEMSEFAVKEARDDAGHSLLPATPFNPALRDARQMNHMVQSHLRYPDHPGKKIVLLRGEITVVLAGDFQPFVEEDVLGTPKVTTPLPGCKVQATVIRQGQDLFRVTIQCSRAGVGDDQWLAMLSHLNDITLTDADGQKLNGLPVSTQLIGGLPQSGFIATALFSQNKIRGVRAGNKNPVIGEAAKLTWNVAGSVKQVVVPVTFKDLPMP